MDYSPWGLKESDMTEQVTLYDCSILDQGLAIFFL